MRSLGISDAMNCESGIPLTQLLVDGGMTGNDFLMQMQADILGLMLVSCLEYLLMNNQGKLEGSFTCS